MKALVFGMSAQMITITASMLSRAGFSVDAILNDTTILSSVHIKTSKSVDAIDLFINCVLEKSNTNNYLLYVPTEDWVLEIFLSSGLPLEEKVKILPVVSLEYESHIFSKIGLSECLRKFGILTPDFFVAHNQIELMDLDKRLLYPYLIKKDRSGGGSGVFLIDSLVALRQIMQNLTYPVLIQKKIDGDLLDLSGFFCKGRLIYFHCSQMLLCRPGQFGPSYLRKFYSACSIGDRYYLDLSELGQALGIDGFTNISAIRSNIDGRLYFIEADLRPNLWIEHGLFIREDPADYIREFFKSDQLAMPRGVAGYGYYLDEGKSMDIPLYSRMTEMEVSEDAFNCNAFRRNYHDAVFLPRGEPSSVSSSIGPDSAKCRSRSAVCDPKE